jgi:hypothetical protein
VSVTISLDHLVLSSLGSDRSNQYVAIKEKFMKWAEESYTPVVEVSLQPYCEFGLIGGQKLADAMSGVLEAVNQSSAANGRFEFELWNLQVGSQIPHLYLAQMTGKNTYLLFSAQYKSLWGAQDTYNLRMTYLPARSPFAAGRLLLSAKDSDKIPKVILDQIRSDQTLHISVQEDIGSGEGTLRLPPNCR